MNTLQKLWGILSRPPDTQLDLLGFVQNPLSDIIDGNIMKMIYSAITGLIKFFEQIILTSPTILMRTDGFWQVYKIVTLLGLTVLAVVIMIASFQKVKDGINMAEVLKKIAWFAPIITIGPYIIIRVIDIFNRLARIIITTDTIIIPDRVTVSNLLGYLLLLIIHAILAGKLIYYYAIRNAALLFLSLTLPVWVALWCLPIYDDVIDRYIKVLLKPLKTQIFHSIVLLMLSSIILTAAEINNLMALVFQIGCLGLMNKAESVLTDLLGDVDKLTDKSIASTIKKNKKRYDKAKKGTNLVKGAIKFFKGGF